MVPTHLIQKCQQEDNQLQFLLQYLKNIYIKKNCTDKKMSGRIEGMNGGIL